MKIMIVDDEPDIVLLMSTFLEKAGYSVVGVGSGEECLEKLKESKVDLILMDIMMPGMDGFEACKRIKGGPKTKDIPVIMLTVKGKEKDVLKGMKLGAVDYFPKPFSFAVLLGKINSVLKTKKTEEELEMSVRRELDREMNILTLKEQIKELESELKKTRSGRGLRKSESDEDYLKEEKPKKVTPKKKVTKAKPEKKKAPAKAPAKKAPVKKKPAPKKKTPAKKKTTKKTK
jgi:DNA-binding response OmpR family regulator